MDRERVIKIYNSLLTGERESLKFSKEYKIFEELYELYKNDLYKKGIIRKENEYELSCRDLRKAKCTQKRI